MSIVHNEEAVRHIMESMRIGKVSHIDFTPINKKPGFGENVDGVVKSAFVHFSDATLISFWHEISWDRPYKIQVREREYWICLKNKNPVKRTLMNIHQVVENGRHLENLIEEQGKKIQEQQEIIEKLSNKLGDVQKVVYQLLGGLFDETQGEILGQHLRILFSGQVKTKDTYEEQEESKWGIWPTTRQGYNCERRIEELERVVEQLKSEEQDTALYARKHYINYDESTICSELVDELEIDRILERDRLLEEEDRHNEMREEALADKAASLNGW